MKKCCKMWNKAMKKYKKKIPTTAPANEQSLLLVSISTYNTTKFMEEVKKRAVSGVFGIKGKVFSFLM